MSTIEKSVLEDLLRREFNFTNHELNVYQNTLALVLPAINPSVNEHYYHIFKPLEKTVEQVIALIREKLCKYYDELDKFLETRYYRGAKTAGSKVKNISFDMKVGEYVYHAVPGNESTSQPYKLFTIAKA